MSEHTPGPWKVVMPDEDDKFDTEIVVGMKSFLDNPGRYRSIDRWLSETCVGPGEKGYEEHLANARLIAAAPDLLEALVMVRDADEDSKRDLLSRIPSAARAKIDAAIAKAVKP